MAEKWKAFDWSPWDEGDCCVTGRAPGEEHWESTPLWGFCMSKSQSELVARWLNSLNPDYLRAMAKLFNTVADFNDEEREK